jgi:hypothetical protein
VVIAPHSVIAPILSVHIDPAIAPPLCHCEERSNPSAVAQRHGLPRRCAPRNDAGWSLRPRYVIAPILSVHIDPVIAPILSLHIDPVIARPCRCISTPSLRPALSLRGTKQSIGRGARTWIATALRASQ